MPVVVPLQITFDSLHSHFIGKLEFDKASGIGYKISLKQSLFPQLQTGKNSGIGLKFVGSINDP